MNNYMVYILRALTHSCRRLFIQSKELVSIYKHVCAYCHRCVRVARTFFQRTRQFCADKHLNAYATGNVCAFVSARASPRVCVVDVKILFPPRDIQPETCIHLYSIYFLDSSHAQRQLLLPFSIQYQLFFNFFHFHTTKFTNTHTRTHRSTPATTTTTTTTTTFLTTSRTALVFG